MKNIILIAFLVYGGSFFYSAAAQSKKEVLLVEVYSSAIFLIWPDKETEVIDMVGPLTQAKIKERGKIIRDLFQRLYDEGWKIETSTNASAGAAEVIEYILVRDK